jgi:hypothetical protein
VRNFGAFGGGHFRGAEGSDADDVWTIVGQSQEGINCHQLITGGDGANHRRGVIIVEQSQKGSDRHQPITEGDRLEKKMTRAGQVMDGRRRRFPGRQGEQVPRGHCSETANHRRCSLILSQSQEGSDQRQSIAVGEQLKKKITLG